MSLGIRPSQYSIYDLPKELIGCICDQVEIFDTVNYKATCKHFYDYVKMDITFPELIITKCSCRDSKPGDGFVPYKVINLKQFHTIYDQFKLELYPNYRLYQLVAFQIHVTISGVKINYEDYGIVVQCYNRSIFVDDAMIKDANPEKYCFRIWGNYYCSDDENEENDDYSTINQPTNNFLKEIIRRCLKMSKIK